MKLRKIRELRPYEIPIMVRSNAHIRDLVEEFMKNPSLHHLCVVDEKEALLGLINRKRVFKAIFHHHISPEARLSKLISYVTAETSSDLMLTHVFTCREDEEIYDLIKMMIEQRIREVPVVDKKNRVLGFVTIPMLLKKWLEGMI